MLESKTNHKLITEIKSKFYFCEKNTKLKTVYIESYNVRIEQAV